MTSIPCVRQAAAPSGVGDRRWRGAIRFPRRLVSVTPLLFSLLACSPAGEVGARGHAEAEAQEPVGITVFTDQVLLFLEFPPLVRGEPSRMLAHLSVLATGEPVRSGSVVLEAKGAAGQVLRFSADKPARDGLFTPIATIGEAGSYEARLLLDSGQGKDVVPVGTLTVHADAASIPSEAAASIDREVPFLMEQQWKVGLLLHAATTRTLVQRVDAPARIVVPDGARAAVTAPMSGRLCAPDGGDLPRTGDRVEAGQLLGYVEPPLGPADLVQLEVLRLEFDLKSLEIERALAGATARQGFAARELERAQRLLRDGLRTQQQVEQAEQELLLARSELESATAGKQALDRLRQARAQGVGAGAVRLPIRAPIAGVVEAMGHSVGEHVLPEDLLLRLADASAVWVDVQASEFDLQRLGRADRGTLQLDGLPDRPLAVGEGGVGRQLLLGAAVEPVSRTLLVRFLVPNPDGELRPGMVGVMRLASTVHKDAVALPASAVVLEHGQPSAYVMLEGETFQKRELQLGIRDGDFVEVLAGIQPGDRVATRGANAVKLAALSPAAFGPGHVH